MMRNLAAGDTLPCERCGGRTIYGSPQEQERTHIYVVGVCSWGPSYDLCCQCYGDTLTMLGALSERVDWIEGLDAFIKEGAECTPTPWFPMPAGG